MSSNGGHTLQRRRGIPLVLFACLAGLSLVSLSVLPSMLYRERGGLNPRETTEVVRGPRGSKKVALTFDAGGDSTGTQEILTTLSQYNVRCTFFLTGEWAERNPALVADIVAGGHELGNHTRSHRDLTRLEEKEIQREVDTADRVLQLAQGFSTRPLIRVPYGARNARVLTTLNRLGYASIYWSLDSLDSVPPPKSASFLAKRILERPTEELDGAIVLMHLGEPSTDEALAEILEQLRSRGLIVVPVTSLFAPSIAKSTAKEQ